MLKIAVTEAPEKGKANEAILDQLTQLLKVKPAQLSLVSGRASPKKVFLVTGLDLDQILERIQGALSKFNKK